MSTLSPETVQRQIIGLNTLRKEADALGNLIADEAWDSFEHELEDLTGDGIHWELADYLSSSLPMQLGVAFDERCEHWLGQRLDSLSKQLPQGIDAPDTGHDFYSILKGQRLAQRFAPQFANLFERSKPGIFSLLARSLIDDVEYAVNHMKRIRSKMRSVCGKTFITPAASLLAR